ncbi:MAG: DUF1707 domain-containing protein [Actinophytocola sp.]|nr:DUF1707 domain-containing protein [Actinophytocola sp.]
MTDPRIRASDADRHRVVAELERQVGTGRLTLDEFSERAGLAYEASTVGDLAGLTSDLPPELPDAKSVGSRSRRIPSAVVVVAAVLAFLLGGAALATGTMPATASPMTGMSCH